MLGLLLAVMCAGAALGEDCGAPIPGGGGRTGNVSLTDKCITVMGFNIQVFGLTKMGKPDVVTSLEKILCKADISGVQEIRDSSRTSFTQLVNAVQGHCSQRNLTHIETVRLGRSSSKESYGIISDETKVEIVEYFMYNDTNDRFEREPLVVHFKMTINGHEFHFLYIICHIKPGDALNETNLLVRVTDWAVAKTGIANVIVIGDFNAGCSYMNVGERRESLLLNNATYWSLFGDNTDSTTSNSVCPYDRVLIHGEELQAMIPKDSAQIYHFDNEQGLTQDEAKVVSDHYPVEFKICEPE